VRIAVINSSSPLTSRAVSCCPAKLPLGRSSAVALDRTATGPPPRCRYESNTAVRALAAPKCVRCDTEPVRYILSPGCGSSTASCQSPFHAFFNYNEFDRCTLAGWAGMRSPWASVTRIPSKRPSGVEYGLVFWHVMRSWLKLFSTLTPLARSSPAAKEQR
jgi:hypothetical protein